MLHTVWAKTNVNVLWLNVTSIFFFSSAYLWGEKESYFRKKEISWMRVASWDRWDNSHHEDGLVIQKVLTGGECSQVQNISQGSNDRANAIISSTFPALLCKSHYHEINSCHLLCFLVSLIPFILVSEIKKKGILLLSVNFWLHVFSLFLANL